MAKVRRTTLFSVLSQSNSRRLSPEEIGREWRTLLAVALVAAGLVLGGGGTSNPLTEVILQVLAALLIGVWCMTPDPAAWNDRCLPLVWVLVLALPLVQLVPLPPSVWQALPGRELARDALTLVGKGDAWMPLSLAPAQTLAVVLAIVPPLALMGLVATLDLRGRQMVLRAIVAVCILSVIIGAFQLVAPAGQTLSFYDYIHRGWVIGFQASRNAEVDVLLIGLLSVAALYALGPSPRVAGSRGLLYGAVALVMIVGAIFTGSRGGIVLIPVAVLGALLMLQRGSIAGRGTLIAASGMLLAGVLAAWSLRDNVALGRVAARFAADRDFRTELWTDTLYAIGQYWPVGGGMGSFVTLMTPVERLEVVDPTLPSRAHNDYLELLLESGIVGPIVVAIVLTLLVLVAVRSWRLGPGHRVQVKFASAAIFIIAAHSLVDYPMRSMSLAMLAATAAGFLFPPSKGGSAGAPTG
jgi:O-antigen ligase